MTQPPPVPASRKAADETGRAEGAEDASTTPHLLVMPAGEGAPPAVPWPGPAGEPAWAIPVTIPPGTRGYAVFIPLVPTEAGGPVAPAAPATPVASVAGTGSPATPTAPAAPAGPAVPAGTPTVPAGTGSPATATPDAGSVAASGPDAGSAAVSGAGAEPAGQPSRVGGEQSAAREPQPEAPRAEAVPADRATGGAPGGGAPAAGGAVPATGTPTPPATTPPTAPVAATPAAGPAPMHRPWFAPPPPGTPGAAAHHWPTYQRPPRQPSFFDKHWHGPEPAQGRAVPAAILAGALGLAFFVPLSRTGIGWFLGWLVLTAGVVVAVRPALAELPRAERLVRAGWAVAALALLSVLAFRNAWWLVTFCVLGALGCATLAIVGGRLVRSILFSLVGAPIAAIRGLPWVRRHLEAPADPGLVRRIAGSAAATLAALIVFGALLSSADGAFSVVLGAVMPEVNGGAVFRWIFLAAVGALCAVAAVYTLSAPPDLTTLDKPTTRRLGMVEWAPVITALTLLFAGFVAVQFTVLFGGQRHVLRTAGLSYAEYARSGFWQLVIVTLLTLAVLGGVARWARRDTRIERILLRVLLGTLSALSFVIVVSALSRMYTYQKVYSFTGERLFVMALELLLGTVFLMILAAGLKWRGTWIPRATVALAVVMLLSLAVLNPEDYAARRNIARYEQTGKIDAWYLRALSADATPALAGLPDPVRRCTLSWIADDLADPDPWYAWNLGRTRARQALDRVGSGAVGGPSDCRAADEFDLPKTRQPR